VIDLDFGRVRFECEGRNDYRHIGLPTLLDILDINVTTRKRCSESRAREIRATTVRAVWTQIKFYSMQIKEYKGE
jgi:hypothetical protein